MALYVCIGMLAAFGLVWVLWLIYGMCCGKPDGLLLIVSGRGQGLIRRCLWLRELGLLRSRMAVISPELDAVEIWWLRQYGIEIWPSQDLTEGYGTGEKRYGAGTGNPPGCHQCGGISEL